MPGLERNALNDDLTRATRHELRVAALVAHDGLALVDVEVAVRERDAGVPGLADVLDDVRLAIARRIAQRDDRHCGSRTGRSPRSFDRRVHVAVGSDDDMAGVADAVGED